MSMTTSDWRQAESALDDALLEQTSLLTTLVTRRDLFIDQAELMRTVKSYQSLLSASPQFAAGRSGPGETGACRPGAGASRASNEGVRGTPLLTGAWPPEACEIALNGLLPGLCSRSLSQRPLLR